MDVGEVVNGVVLVLDPGDDFCFGGGKVEEGEPVAGLDGELVGGVVEGDDVADIGFGSEVFEVESQLFVDELAFLDEGLQVADDQG